MMKRLVLLLAGLVSACGLAPDVTPVQVSSHSGVMGAQRTGLEARLSERSWIDEIGTEFDKPYFQELEGFLATENAAGHEILPAENLVFNAFNTTPFEAVNVVILGQDPYPTPGQAMGLSFSVQDGVAPPASLRNMYQELRDDLGVPSSTHGNLTQWARQGVLLLNTTLTVAPHAAGSHQGQGWETFTDQVIRRISQQRKGVVFLLWGGFAQQKKSLIDLGKHHVLEAAHPSPLSARNGFFGCRHFSKTNEFLRQEGRKPIDWAID